MEILPSPGILFTILMFVAMISPLVFIHEMGHSIGQRHKQIFLRLTIHCTIAANGTCFAAFFPVDNVTLGRSVKAVDHQLLLHHILNTLDLQRLVFFQPTQALLHHLVG